MAKLQFSFAGKWIIDGNCDKRLSTWKEVQWLLVSHTSQKSEGVNPQRKSSHPILDAHPETYT